MIRSVIATLFGLSLLASSSAFAGERTVTLTVQNMYCSACPITVKSSLEAVPGVDKVVVSYEENTAVVTFDDAKTVVPALISATTNAGYPSSLKGRPRITDRSLITTGAIGPILAATCCATPLLKLPARASAERSATARWSPFGFA